MESNIRYWERPPLTQEQIDESNARRQASIEQREREKAERKALKFDPVRDAPWFPRRPRKQAWKPGRCYYCGKALPKPYQAGQQWGEGNSFCTTSCGLAFGLAAVAGGIRLNEFQP